MRAVITWGQASRPKPGEAACGDASVVEVVPGGACLAVIDGLGHGPQAAIASAAAVASLRGACGRSLPDVFRACDEALRATRGVVMTVVQISDSPPTITWAGVGNIEAVLIRADRAAVPPREALLPRGGVVGFNMGPVHPFARILAPGDTVVFGTDGVAFRQLGSLLPGEDLALTAQRFLANAFLGTDDALVLVVRWTP